MDIRAILSSREDQEIKLELSELVLEINILNTFPEETVQITEIQIDSRKVQPGDLFVALPGTQMDGHDFITDAVAAGAAAVIGDRAWETYTDLEVPYLQVKDAREALAACTAAWYGYPARQLVVIGVTGTDGKTTTANYIYSILRAAEIKAGLISTVNAVIGDRVLDTGFHVTTPEASDVQ